MDTITPQPQVSSQLRGQVLQQVYRVWLFRKLAPVLLVEIIILAAVLYGLGQAIFIQRIIENGLNVLFQNPSAIISFMVSAFTKAPLLTQVLGFGFLVLLALIVRHVTQGILRLILVRENYFSSLKK